MWAHPNHKCRLVTAYNIPDSKPEGLMTNYQQIKRYCQRNNINMDPRELFYHDFAKQCRRWRESGETVGILMDANEHAIDGRLYSIISSEGIRMVEFSHRFWGDVPPNSHVDGTDPITAFYGTDNLEVTQLLQLSHMCSVGDHKTWIVEITTRSLLGCNLLKIQRTVGRRLIMSNHGAVEEFNRLVRKGYDDHNVRERMEALMGLVDKTGAPVPGWLKKMIRVLHVDMDNIRLHAEHNCRKIYTPESPFSPEIQAWYDRIHAYLALIKLFENSDGRNRDNTYRFAKRKGIENPKCLTMQEIKEGLRHCRMRQMEARRRAHPLREDHMLECLKRAMSQKRRRRQHT